MHRSAYATTRRRHLAARVSGAEYEANTVRRANMNTLPPAAYELRYTSLFNEGRALSFPCDRTGRVNLDALSQRARANYLYARAVVGKEFAMPAVRLCDTH